MPNGVIMKEKENLCDRGFKWIKQGQKVLYNLG